MDAVVLKLLESYHLAWFWIMLIYFLVLILTLLIMSGQGVKKGKVVTVAVVFIVLFMIIFLLGYLNIDTIIKWFGIGG
jgi:hypothetical protein